MKKGRPSSYTKEVGDEICRLVASGMSLRRALLEPGMPDRNTVNRWAESVHEFRKDLVCAREDCADWHADHGVEVLQSAMGQPKEIVTAAREIARHHLSLARVVDPRRYGEKVEVEHSGSVQGMGAVSINITAAQAAPVLAACQPVLDVQAEKPALPESDK